MLKTLAVTAMAISLMITLSLIGVVHAASALANASSATDYPRLATVLFQLSQAANPARFASEHRLQYMLQGWVRVVIELQNVQAMQDANYHLAISAQYGNWIQTWAPLSELLRLAQDPNVIWILPIFRPSEAQKI